jgi:hypothetical protein
MMTTIRARCPRCGEVDMDPDAIMLSAETEFGAGSYLFVCPACLEPVEKRADQKVVELLRSVGVRLSGSAGGGEEAPSERERPVPSAPPFTYDDLLSFHFLLEDDERLSIALFAGMDDRARGSPAPPT